MPFFFGAVSLLQQTEEEKTQATNALVFLEQGHSLARQRPPYLPHHSATRILTLELVHPSLVSPTPTLFGFQGVESASTVRLLVCCQERLSNQPKLHTRRRALVFAR